MLLLLCKGLKSLVGGHDANNVTWGFKLVRLHLSGSMTCLKNEEATSDLIAAQMQCKPQTLEMTFTSEQTDAFEELTYSSLACDAQLPAYSIETLLYIIIWSKVANLGTRRIICYSLHQSYQLYNSDLMSSSL